MPKIYDCFNFFNEIEILEMRLNILYEYVDHFVIVESSVTHTGIHKEFIFEKNMDRFYKFTDKIIYFKVIDTPDNFIDLPSPSTGTVRLIYDFIEKQTIRFDRHTQPDYGRDFYQKECVRIPLLNCGDDDIIMISDVDEIPNPKLVARISDMNLENNIFSLNQMMYYYYLNVFKESTWYGTKLSKYKNIKDLSFNEVRGDESLSVKIPNGGWHFSFMGGEDMVKTKLLSYSARDMANGTVLSSVSENIRNNIDPFFRGGLTLVNIDESYPEYLLKNIEKYRHLIKMN